MPTSTLKFLTHVGFYFASHWILPVRTAQLRNLEIIYCHEQLTFNM